MHMDIGLDTGDMISKVEVPIYPDDDFEKLHDRMADAGAKLLVDTIPSIEDGTAKREQTGRPQVDLRREDNERRLRA